MKSAYERFLKSKLTQAAFCKAEALSPSQFGYWHKRFSSEAAAPAPVTGFSQLNLSPAPIATPINPVMVLDLAGKGRLNFMLRWKFLFESVISLVVLALTSSCRYFLYGKGTDMRCGMYALAGLVVCND